MTVRVDVTPADEPLLGSVSPPGDKSMSHRAVLFSAMAEGTSTLTGVLDSADVRSSISVMRGLGADVDLAPGPRGLHGVVTGWGSRGPRPGNDSLDSGNSGTTCRLAMGVLAGYPVRATLTGDESLSARPMRRIADPLESMGATVATTDGCLPVTVQGGDLEGIEYDSPVASAQVKSAVLLAGLNAAGTTSVTEPAHSRDHTERMLPAFGASLGIDVDRRTVSLTGPQRLRAATIEVPADPSSAAFHAVAAAIVPDSVVRIEGVSLNATRTGYLTVLERMGADIEIETHEPAASEPVGVITISAPSRLEPTVINPAEVPSLIDEIPVLAVAAALAHGVTRFEGVGELRVKESDRLAAIQETLGMLGVETDVESDILSVTGVESFAAASLDSLGDHRLAMAWAVAALRAEAPVTIDGFEAVDVSYPDFLSDLRSLRG
jgi:3-phosphoshikimate 1-carboxyvinyltransferase